ncbi:hypothetical protein [Nannocystis pusilla]|uniref:hypothetical protein n=1 Tax=Nannocystis pusilla TaxID=889268 RepID=UPI003DA535DC
MAFLGWLGSFWTACGRGEGGAGDAGELEIQSSQLKPPDGPRSMSFPAVHYSEITGLAQGNSEVQDRTRYREHDHRKPDEQGLVGLFFGHFFGFLRHFTQVRGIGWRLDLSPICFGRRCGCPGWVIAPVVVPDATVQEPASSKRASPRATLHDLLCRLFTVEELRRFARHLYHSPPIEQSLPVAGNLADFVDGFISLIDRRGLLDEHFFNSLARQSPARTKEIKEVAKLWGIDIDPTEENPKPPEKPKEQAQGPKKDPLFSLEILFRGRRINFWISAFALFVAYKLVATTYSREDSEPDQIIVADSYEDVPYPSIRHIPFEREPPLQNSVLLEPEAPIFNLLRPKPRGSILLEDKLHLESVNPWRDWKIDWKSPFPEERFDIPQEPPDPP